MDNLDKELIRNIVLEELRKRQFGKTVWDKIEIITFRTILFSGLVSLLFFIIAIITKTIYLI